MGTTLRRGEVWSAELVEERFKEAVETAHRLPSAKVRGHFNSWPMIVRQSWEVLSSHGRSNFQMDVTADLIDRMEETTRWVQWLGDPVDRHVVWGYASGLRRNEMVRQHSLSRSTIDRRHKSALQRIANLLNHNAEGRILTCSTPS